MAGKTTIDIDPSIVLFTHSRIRPFFTGCGRRIEDTLNDLLEGRLDLDALPLITVIENDGNYFSLNNRRLYVLKQLRSRDLLINNTIRAYIKPALEREKKKYTVENCAMEARIMNEHHHSTSNEADSKDEVALSDSETNAAKPGTAPPKPKVVAPLTLKNCKISPDILNELKDLKKLVSKGKTKVVMSRIDEWLLDDRINESQRDFVMRELEL